VPSSWRKLTGNWGEKGQPKLIRRGERGNGWGHFDGLIRISGTGATREDIAGRGRKNKMTA